jgi:hypothetical protein
MKKIFEINFSPDFDLGFLLLLFPTITLHTTPTLTSDTCIFTNCPFDEKLYPDCKTLFIKKDKGIPIDYPSGFWKFLKKIDYLTEFKINKLKNTFNLIDDKMPNEVIHDLYKAAFVLKMANCLLPETLILVQLFEYLTLPLPERINKILEFKDDHKTFGVILTMVDTYYNSRGKLNKGNLDNYQKVFSKFNFEYFYKNFHVSGAISEDLSNLLTFF